MRRIGLPPEPRKFLPHITLARIKGASVLAVADSLSMRAIIRPISFTAKRFVLYSSRASTGGGPYIIEAAYPMVFDSFAAVLEYPPHFIVDVYNCRRLLSVLGYLSPRQFEDQHIRHTGKTAA